MGRVAQNPQPYFTVSSEILQPGGRGSRIYIPQEQGDPVIPPGTDVDYRMIKKGSDWKMEGSV
jgi:hypothetical protein